MAPDDDLTLRHLSRQRIRGAPATIPGTTGFVRDYAATEVLRQTQRSLVCPMVGEIDLAKVAAAFASLPARKHELTRPYLLHRLVSGEDGNLAAVIEVQVPATLSIKPVRAPGVPGEEAT